MTTQEKKVAKLMKKRMMIMLLSLLTVGAAVLGYSDDGNMTAALICGLLLIAVICDKGEKEDVL